MRVLVAEDDQVLADGLLRGGTAPVGPPRRSDTRPPRRADERPAPRNERPARERPRPFDAPDNGDRVAPRTLAPDDLRHRLNRAAPAAPAPRERAPSRQPGPRPEGRGPAAARPAPFAGARHDTRRQAPRHDDDDDDDHVDVPHAPGSMRLSKRMSELGIASRREADDWIDAGWVSVDGVMAVLGQRVLPHQKIEVASQARTEQARRVTILLHKPIGYVSGQAEDGRQRRVGGDTGHGGTPRGEADVDTEHSRRG